MDQPAPTPVFTIPADQTLTLKSFEPTALTMTCGEGQVVISLKTGKVTLNNCTLDDGAKAFWKAVEHMFPRAR